MNNDRLIIGGVAAAIVAALGLTSAAQAATTQVDLSSYVNYEYEIGGQPSGVSAGNTSSSVAATTFDLLDPGGDNVWIGASTGASVDIAVNIADATQAMTLMNTLYGQAGLDTATVEFLGANGASLTFTLVGNSDIRDYNNWIWTNSINGTTTQEWWTNNLSPTPDDLSHRLDAQIFNLGTTFLGTTLTDVVVTAGQAGANYSQPLLFALNVTGESTPPIPEASTWAMMLVGFAGLGVLVRRSARAKAAQAA